MRLISYWADQQVRLGVLQDDRVVDLQRAARAMGHDLPSSMRSFIELGEAGLDLAEAAVRTDAGTVDGPVRLAPPIPDLRKNVFCVGRNYRLHIIEGARARGVEPVFPEFAEFFTKAPTAVIGHEDAIVLDHRETQKLDYEIELAFVIGRGGKNIPAQSAYDAIYGFTVANDVSARDVQLRHNQWFKGKSMDTFCPLGPCIVPRRYIADPQNLRLVLRVNGEVRQDANTADMLFNIPTIVEQLSKGLTLESGDIVLTGTPSGVALGMNPPAWLRPGDVIEAEIEQIGILRNRVEAAEER